MKLLIPLILVILGSRADAFQILSAITNPCHEDMTLGTFGYGPTEYHATPMASSLMTRFLAKVSEIGIPNDRGTQAIIKEMTARFHWDGLDPRAQYILTSLVAGNRMPDTHGFSIIDIDHIRDNHLTDSAQAIHMLRKKDNDGEQGNVDAIAQTRAIVTGFLNSALSTWSTPAALTTTQTWAFPFYGEQNVQLFAPAFTLGEVAHSIEDSYSHAIRDNQFNILAVANYIEAMGEGTDEALNGPPHSERLDQCNMANAFDAMRVTEAQRQVVLVFNEMDSLLGANATDDSTVETILNSTFVHIAGCDSTNNYCDTPWIDFSRQEISQPYKLGFNCGLVKRVNGSGGGGWPPAGGLALLIGLLFAPIAVSLKLRRQTS